MAKINKGLKELTDRELLPDGEYKFKATGLLETNDGTGELARLLVLKGPDASLKGKSTVMYIYNKVTDQAIGLGHIARALQLEHVSSTEDIIGGEFEATVTQDVSKRGQPVNNVTPHYDAGWWNEFLGAPASRSRKKASRRR